MAISFYSKKDKKDYFLNHYRSKKLKEGYLVTNDYGSWVFLSSKEFQELKSENITNSLLDILIDKKIALTKDNIKNNIDEYRKKWGYLFQGTSLHIVVPTLRCNLKCVYCHAKAKGKDEIQYDMDEKTAKKTVDFIFQSPSEAITIEFQGGEPLLRFDLVKYIIEYTLKANKKFKKNIQFSVVTNLTLMKKKYFDYFRSKNVGICTSLDGNELVHNKNRAEYKKTATWIKKILSKYTLNAMLLTTKHTLPYHKEIVDEYIKFKLPRIWIKPVNNLGFARSNWKKIGMSSEEYLQFWKKTIDYIVKKNKNTPIIENYIKIILQKILTNKSVNFTDLQSPCGASIGQLAYNYDGNIYSCDEGRLFEIFKLGTVDNSYIEIVTSGSSCAIVKASINDNPYCERCVYKPYCGLCPVCHYAKTNNIISKLPDERCKILMGMFDYIFEKLLNDEEYRKVFMGWI